VWRIASLDMGHLSHRAPRLGADRSDEDISLHSSLKYSTSADG